MAMATAAAASRLLIASPAPATSSLCPGKVGTHRRRILLLRCSDSSNATTDIESGPTAPVLVSKDRGLVSTWFDDAYQYKAWPGPFPLLAPAAMFAVSSLSKEILVVGEVHRLLSQRNVQCVESQDAYDMTQSGKAILIDVREVRHFEKIHAQGAFGAPLFRLIEGNDLKSNMRRLGYALITDFAGTERNPDFVKQALEAVNGDTDKQVIVLCDIGGTLSTIVERKGPKAKKYADPERRFGRASRSLKAVYDLQEAGFSNVVYLNGGFNAWLHEDFPTEGTWKD